MRLTKGMLALAVSVAVLTGCNGDSNEPDVAEGEWLVTFNSTSGDNLTCAMPNLLLSINHANNTFIGDYVSDQVFCMGPGGPTGGPAAGGAILSGLLETDIEFYLGLEPSLQDGTVDVTLMSGTAVWTVTFGADVYTLNGNWVATKTPRIP